MKKIVFDSEHSAIHCGIKNLC